MLGGAAMRRMQVLGGIVWIVKYIENRNITGTVK
jgi:hypothetical protein